MKNIEDLIKYLSDNPAGDFEGEKSEDLIQKAEVFLGLKFPSDYRDFLSKLGCGDINGTEIYGIISDEFENSSIPNMVWLTNNRRKEFSVPKNLIFIASSDEYDFVIDTKQGKDGKSPVLKWFTNGDTKLAYTSFYEFVRKYVLKD